VSVYAALTIGAAATVYVRALVVALASVEAGRRLHSAALGALLRAPMSFFDSTPIGQILNRFSTDTQVRHWLARWPRAGRAAADAAGAVARCGGVSRARTRAQARSPYSRSPF
jgi:hypothetical protein